MLWHPTILLVLACTLGSCSSEPLPDCRTAETCPALETFPDAAVSSQPGAKPPQPTAHVALDLSQPAKPISDDLFGIFFEEILHGGEGGIYAELVQDRGFEGLAHASGYQSGQLQPKDVTHFLKEWPLHLAVESTDPRSWAIGQSTTAQISQIGPNDRGNPTYISIKSPHEPARLSNHGFWGLAVQQGAAYELSLHLRAGRGCQEAAVEVFLEAGNASHPHAGASFAAVPSNWTQHTARLTSNTTATNGRLVIQAPANCSMDVDMVSLFPAKNGRLGAITPFRPDLLSLLQGLRPKFIRLPGGCYVEGTRMSNAYLWKPSVGSLHQRPGHWNGQWKYWSTDGLGLYEYMLLAEALDAQPIWVINNGIAHEDAVATSHIAGLVQDALDALDFILGPADSKWGGLRASMGHPQPWSMQYMGIGNEDCGKQYYASNYRAFYSAIKARWPHLVLVANCDLHEAGPTDMFDWHWYTSASSIFHARPTFDAVPRGPGLPQVFASEYAVFDWGRKPLRPYGNMEDAVGEAGFMTGLEQNADVVRMAAFAPMLTNVQHQPVGAPNTLVSFDNHRVAVSPSYHVQALFAQHAGPWLVPSSVNLSVISDVAVSATCSDAACTRLACKLVNWGSAEKPVKLVLTGAEARGAANVTVLASPHRLDTNTLEEPNKVAPQTHTDVPMDQLDQLRLPPASLTVISLHLG